MKPTKIALPIALAALVGVSATGAAQGFHGFDPPAYTGTPLSSRQLQAMVVDAMKVTPPKNGKRYVIGFANLERDIPFGKLVERGIQAAATAAGVELMIVDNDLSGPIAVTNARAFVAGKVDYAIEFQTDVTFAPNVMTVLDQAGIRTAAIDIPMPGATFFGVNNPAMGYMGGAYLAQAATSKFGGRLKGGYLVIGSLPQSGVVPAIRTASQKAGFLDSIDGFPTSQVILIDTKNTNRESYLQMRRVLTRIPMGAPIMVTAINDQAALGMLGAIKEAHRENDAIVVGNGADEAAALATEPTLVAATASFPDRYGNFLLPIALASLAGKQLPPAIFVTHQMVTKATICQFDTQFSCAGSPPITFRFPQTKFERYLKTLTGRRDLKGYEALIPKV